MKIYKHSVYPFVTIVRVLKTEILRLDFALCRQPRETLEDYYRRQGRKPDVLMNGGLFNMSDGGTCMTMMDEFRTVSEDGWSVGGMGIVDNADIVCGNFNERNDWRDFLSGYPVLIYHGKPVGTAIARELDYRTQRSVIGYNKEAVFLVTVGKPGLNFDELRKVLLNIGVEFAINLDGGGSSRLLVDGKKLTGGLYSRPVDNVIGVYLREAGEEEHHKGIIYRVQTGAFSSKANAERLRAKIAQLPDDIHAGYAHAYVRKVEGLYKVQVGAFSKRENAERVRMDLRKKGYSSFTTDK